MDQVSQDDWQPIAPAAASGGDWKPASQSDDWQTVGQQESLAAKSPDQNRSFGENTLRQIGLAGRDIASAVPMGVAGVGDAVNSAINGATGLSNKYMGTNIPQLGMPTQDVQNAISSTGAFPEYENNTERNVGTAADVLLGGGEGGVQSVKQGYRNLVDMIPQKATAYDPMQVMKGISDSFSSAIDKANQFYGFPQQLAEGKSVYAPQIANHLDSIIDNVNADPFHEARSQVGTLQRIRDSLPDDGTVPVNDILDIRKFTNKNFNPARLTDKSSTYGKLNSVADSALNTAKQQIPNFGDALDIADNYWRNGVAQPFLNNKVLQKAGWSPLDAHNLRMVDEGMVDPDLIDETKQKAANIVNKVQDVNTYNAVRRTLPDDVGQSFDAAVLQSLPTHPRVAAVLKTLSNAGNLAPLNTAKSAISIANASRPEDQAALIKAIKNGSSYVPLSDKGSTAEAAFENLVKANMNGKGQPLALPAPSINVPPDGFGSPVAESATTEPISSQKLLGRGDNDTFYTPRNRALPAPGPIQVPPDGFKRTYNPYDLNSGDEPRAIQTLDDIASGEKSSGGRASYATGGAINTNPSAKQIEAGNYKKGHIKIYGLNITIENPKGSIRRGIGKDGKPWETVLPADYGYFKKTEAADGEHIDCYIGPKHGSPRVYCIDQIEKDSGKYDEVKCMLGFMNIEDALHAYCKSFSDGKGHVRIGQVTEMNINQLKDWLKNGNTKKPIARAA